MTKHAELLERHRKVLPNWVGLYYDQPISLVDGSGRHVVDAEGNSYLDFFGGILTTSIGYNIPEITEAVQSQAAKMVHSSTLYLIESQVELAELLVERSGIDDAKAFFVNSGSEANEVALLLATTVRRSNEVLALRNSYHGRSFATVAITGIRSWSPSSLSPINVSYVQGGYRYRSPFKALNDEDYIEACVADLVDVISGSTTGPVACLIVEPIQGVGGFIVPPDGLLAAFKKTADEAGILFVSDEVQTGLARTGGHFWGIENDGITPDMFTFAKGIANGLPIGGIIARRELMDCVPSNSISTFGGNPLTMASALATIRYVDSHNLQANATEMGQRLMTGLRKMQGSCEAIGEVRGKGLMAAIELVRAGTTEPDVAAAATLLEQARRRGLLVGRGGVNGNCIRIAPALSITGAEMDEGLGLLGEAVNSLNEFAVKSV